jgi:predicted ribosomally synthesized peptide with SipW-like signal peptide
MRKKILMPVIALVLVLCCAIGGTLAWLTDKTEPVVNTFTVGDVNIDLTETEREYHILPGVNIEKDPKVTVKTGSEACWLFVKVEETNWPDFKEADGTRKVNYSLADGWTALEGNRGVYYREVTADQAKVGAEYFVLKDNKVTVSGNLTKEELLQVTVAPQLTFTAYAVQYYNGKDVSGEETHFEPADAWRIASNTSVNP